MCVCVCVRVCVYVCVCVCVCVCVLCDISEPSEHTTVVANRVEESRLQPQRTYLGFTNQGRVPLKHNG